MASAQLWVSTPVEPGVAASGRMLVSAVVLAGLGYVGLPLAMRAVAAGHDVTGYDPDLVRVKRLEAGESYVEDASPPASLPRRWNPDGSGHRPAKTPALASKSP